MNNSSYSKLILTILLIIIILMYILIEWPVNVTIVVNNVTSLIVQHRTK